MSDYIDASKFLNEEFVRESMQVCLQLVLILVATLIFWKLTKRALRLAKARIVRHRHKEGPEAVKRIDTLFGLFEFTAKIVVYTLGITTGLGVIGINLGPIIAGAGILGVAIGFGSQNLVKDVVTGLFITLENQVRVGDVATLNDTSGVVEAINLRTIILRDLSGTVHVIPNGNISTLSNMTKGWSAYVMDIGVAYKEDLDKCMDVMRAIGQELKADTEFGQHMLDDNIEIFGVNEFADSAINIKARIRTSPMQQWAVGREYRRRLKARFDREGIEMPFPHLSFYMGEASRPLQVETVESKNPPDREQPAATSAIDN